MTKITLFWLRRDLRLLVFDTDILDTLDESMAIGSGLQAKMGARAGNKQLS